MSSSSAPPQGQKFDAYARSYVDLHRESIRSSGEEPAYFHQYKRRCIERLDGVDFGEPILDYGCGVGTLAEQLVSCFSRVHGFDPSTESVAMARARVPRATFHPDVAEIPEGHFGLLVMSCVLHHVRPVEREGLLRVALTKLRPGGRLVVFEHNPLNPLTRKAVADCPFDDDAVLLWPREARRLLERSGYSRVRRDFIVFLPRALSRLRFIEPYLRAVPIGAQMMLVGVRAA
jgi:SAM-dependent methyltransferase